MNPANSYSTPLFVEDGPHGRLEVLVAVADDQDAAPAEPGLDPGADAGKELGVLDRDDPSGEHHVEPPLDPRAGEPLVEKGVVRDEVAQELLFRPQPRL